jgi:hypothetical protein
VYLLPDRPTITTDDVVHLLTGQLKYGLIRWSIVMLGILYQRL